MTILTTDRLILRPWRDDDCDATALFRYASNPDVGPAAAWPAHTSLTESRSIIRDVLNARETYAVVFNKSNATSRPVAGTPIGSIGLAELSSTVDPSELERRHAMEIGYWIGEPFWGQGLIPEAAGALIRHSFEDLGLTAVWGTHDIDNHKSARVMDKLGLRLIRIHPRTHLALLGNVYRDEAVRRITKKEWTERTAER